MVPELTDPDHVANIWWGAARLLAAAGRFAEADAAVDQLEAVAEGLTPHHRVHGIGSRVEIATMAGRWEEVSRLTTRVEPAVEANLATPCPMNLTSLLDCATASAWSGQLEESRRLEAEADGIGMVGYGFASNPPLLRLGVARGDREQLQRVLDSLGEEEFAIYSYQSWAAVFDALLALGERARIEADAPTGLRAGPYVEPFVLRALGAARGDEALVRDALAKFEAMGLDWHAEETRKLLAD
jgi:hypothetical protein